MPKFKMNPKIIEIYERIPDHSYTYSGQLQAARYRDKKKCLRYIVPSQQGYNGENGTILNDISQKEFNKLYSLKPVVPMPAPAA